MYARYQQYCGSIVYKIYTLPRRSLITVVSILLASSREIFQSNDPKSASSLCRVVSVIYAPPDGLNISSWDNFAFNVFAVVDLVRKYCNTFLKYLECHGTSIVLFAFEPLSVSQWRQSIIQGTKLWNLTGKGYRVYVIADLWSFTWKLPLTESVDLKRCGI